MNNTVNTTLQRIRRRFGFLPNPAISVHKNARHILGQTSPNIYFPPVKKLAFHDLTSTHKLPPTANQLLGLGLKFIPTPRTNITSTELEHTTSRFERDVSLKVFFAGSDPMEKYDPKALRGKSKWRAPLPPLNIDTRVQHFTQHLERSFCQRKTTPNLTRLQFKLLKQIKQNANVTILSADKGLGPVGVDTKQYIEWALKHLLDTTTYTILPESQANADSDTLYKNIYHWTIKHRQSLGDDATRYIREHVEKARADPFGYFYLLAKLHKTPISTRPVCSDCASLPHPVGKWVDRQLQPVVRDQATYFRDSFELKCLLDNLDTLPPSACLFTYDAVSMYTNIDTEECLQRLQHFLKDPETSTKYPHLYPDALIEALHIVMRNNRMKFGNMIVHQHKGIAMGMAPTPSIANLFVAIYEQAHITTFPASSLHFLRRFIDDGFGIWLRDIDSKTDEANWTLFKSIVNSMGLQWEFSPRSSTVTFMDLNIHLRRGRIITSLYTKPMALHLYIPPSSCHAPGVIPGLVHGQLYRIFKLCSHKRDIEREIHAFFVRLLARGHSLCNLTPLFIKAEQEVKQQIATQQQPPGNLQKIPQSHGHETVFLHLTYHPNNPPASEIQRLWRTHLFTPPGEPSLNHLTNREGYRVPIKKLTVAYSRAPNLGNLLSCRKLDVRLEDYTDLLQYHYDQSQGEQH